MENGMEWNGMKRYVILNLQRHVHVFDCCNVVKQGPCKRIGRGAGDSKGGNSIAKIISVC